MGNDRYNAIVVGAEPAGSAAALTMAKNDMSVLIVECGACPYGCPYGNIDWQVPAGNCGVVYRHG